MTDTIRKIEREIPGCTRCPRLVEYCRRVAQEKRRAYRNWEYWGRPVPGLGDPRARLLILGLAPAAHGANRTGRIFTGDRSGDFLFRALHRAGFANQTSSVSRDDGLRLLDTYITATVRCAPPANKPLPEESRNCREYLERELAALRRVAVVVALGKIAFDAYLSILRDRGEIASRSRFHFSHGALYRFPSPRPVLIASYHPSQQNTQTGKLTEKMFRGVFQKVRALLEECKLQGLGQ